MPLDPRGSIPRRAFGLLSVAAAAHVFTACDRRASAGITTAPAKVDGAPRPRLHAPATADWTSLDFPDTVAPSRNGPAFGRAMVRAHGIEGADVPVLVALHGHGESTKGLDVGARAWKDDYHLDAACARLSAPPLSSDDVGGFLTEEQLAELNHGLSRSPFQGLTVACPFTPDMVDPTSDLAIAYGDFIVDRLLPKVREVTSGAGSRVGIDGISMGGRIALMLGLSRPDVFRSIGCMQPFLKVEDARAFADLAARATRKQAIRLMTSDIDPSVDGVKALAQQLGERGVDHEVVIARGPHSYEWVQRAGAPEMLYFHDRALRDGDG